MRFSHLYAPTIKETPSDADVVSYQYLIRGGFIRKVASGIYTYLPLGQRVLLKITQLVREEMNQSGAQELLLPIAQPAEIWKQSGRWEDYGPEMMKLIDRHKRSFTLGPTHEEIITVMVRNELTSYKDLPKNLYQINTKYRDEIRPRFGLLRAREFIMKDAYSFHSTWEDLDQTYQIMYNAYARILERMGLEYMPVEADSGAIGGDASHEFVLLTNNGESRLLHCMNCRYGATEERASYGVPTEQANESSLTLEKKDTPDTRTIEEVAAFLGISPGHIAKSLVFWGKEGPVMALIRGDRGLSEPKLRSFMNDQTLGLADPEQLMKSFGVPAGFVGPILNRSEPIPIIADHSLKTRTNWVVGGTQQDTHYLNAVVDRDFHVNHWADLAVVEQGDPCPKCGHPLSETRGIEMGQVFKLGTKYSTALNAFYTDEKGQQHPLIMGCYGWGVSRTMAGVVEQLHDDQGIIWPKAIAPFQVIVTIVNPREPLLLALGQHVYEKLLNQGFEVLLDDRIVSPGSKFNDADLLGIPIRITIGKTALQGDIEIKKRYEPKSRKIPRTIFEEDPEGIVQQELEEYAPKYSR